MRSWMWAGMPPPVSAMRTSSQRSSARVDTVITPLPLLPPSVWSAMAWAALTRMLRNTWLSSPGRQLSRGRSSARRVSTSATYFHSLRLTVMVLSRARLMSTRVLSSVPGWENSRMARTMVATRSTPSRVCSMVPGISASR